MLWRRNVSRLGLAVKPLAVAGFLGAMALGATQPSVAAPGGQGSLTVENTRKPADTKGRPTKGAEAAHDMEGWTSQQMSAAQELPLPIPAQRAEDLAPMSGAELQAAGASLAGEPGGGAGNDAPDVQNSLFQAKRLDRVEPKAMDESGIAGTSGAITPDAYGSFGAHFSSSRLVPRSARTSYPFRAVGKLFFKKGTANYVCSAAVLKPRLILTAGHCVYDAVNRRWHSNLVFVPAYENGNAPYGSWVWNWAIVTGQWASGGGGVPNAADYAIVELRDQYIFGGVRKLGHVTGWLGWQTNSLASNHTKKLGYPCNHDSCQIMHQVDSQSFRTVSPNNVMYGSDMRGGSSGGPWVQNFGTPAAGQTGAYNSGLNRIVGVTSWGYTNTGPKVQGSSILNSTFTSILNTACSRSGNC